MPPWHLPKKWNFERKGVRVAPKILAKWSSDNNKPVGFFCKNHLKIHGLQSSGQQLRDGLIKIVINTDQGPAYLLSCRRVFCREIWKIAWEWHPNCQLFQNYLFRVGWWSLRNWISWAEAQPLCLHVSHVPFLSRAQHSYWLRHWILILLSGLVGGLWASLTRAPEVPCKP